MEMSVETVTGFKLLDILSQVGLVGYTILGILFIFSIFAWGIILYKYRFLKTVHQESEKFLELYHENSDLGEVYAASVAFRTASVVRVFKAGYLDLQRIRKEMMTIKAERKGSSEVNFEGWVEDFTSILQESLIRENAILERFLTFLAVTSSTAPLLGLFGTVWGVMVAFWSIGIQGSTHLAAIAPGISAALVTTVGGLVTAIPAVVAYNALLSRIKILSAELECFASSFTSTVRRELRKAL